MPGSNNRANLPRGGENHENLNLDNGRQMDSGIKFFGTILPHVLEQTKITCSFRKPLPP